MTTAYSADVRSSCSKLDDGDGEGLLSPQRLLFAQLCDTILEHRAALLVSPTGSGKSFIAAALARWFKRRFGVSTMLVVPARLKPTWARVMEQMGAEFEHIVSHERWSRAAPPQVREPSRCLWVVDEAHAFRHASTIRHASLGRAMIGGWKCLCTATPICTEEEDLQSMLSLMGQARLSTFSRREVFAALAVGLSSPELELSVCRTELQIDWGEEELGVLEALGQIDWPSLGQHSNEQSLLLHLFSARFDSHPLSLVETLKRVRRLYRRAMSPTGVVLARKALQRLFAGVSMQQGLLGFVWDEVCDDAVGTISGTLGKQRASQEERAKLSVPVLQALCERLGVLIGELERACARQPDRKLAVIEQFLEERLGEPQFGWLRVRSKAVLFTQYESTARVLWRALLSRWSVGLLCGAESRCGYQRVRPEQLLRAFEPGGESTSPQLLVCTDVLSTGHNLQTASVLVHVDEAWNPVLLRQREGRLLRLGQRAEQVVLARCRSVASGSRLQQYGEDKQRALSRRRALQDGLVTASGGGPCPRAARLFVLDEGWPRFWLVHGDGEQHVLHARTASDLIRCASIRSIEPFPLRPSRCAWKLLRSLGQRLWLFRRHPESGEWWQRLARLRKQLSMNPGVFVDLLIAEWLELGPSRGQAVADSLHEGQVLEGTLQWLHEIEEDVKVMGSYSEPRVVGVYVLNARSDLGDSSTA
ncbi:MAG: helicase-related protein [Myxococcota bacterium]|jgi:hypothetical protein|nr:helicase-related protein [Myxococcota bacterium]